jgi:hypothetical protein
MLEMRSQCELCRASLGQNAEDAWICSFECTFCTELCRRRAARDVPELSGGIGKAAASE